MRLIGITGSVASGKSMVAGLFERLGAGVIDADQLGHEALRLPQVEAAARERWGDEIFGSDNRIDRARLAKIVFAPGIKGQTERTFLEQLTHPEIGRLARQRAEALAVDGRGIIVLDAALLTEAGWNEGCDKIVFVDAPRETRLARATARGWDEADFTAREAAQDSLERKRRHADVIIENSGSPEQAQAQVERFWASLVR